MRRSLPLFAVTCGLACAAADPQGSDRDGDSDGPVSGAPCAAPPSFTEEVSGCSTSGTDYQPRVNGSADDTWPACISDDNLYHPVQPSISSIARVAAFEVIGDLLWKNDKVPAAADFIDARIAYEEEQGLSSRLSRRYDTHYPPPPAGSCDTPAVATENPDYCIGPAQLQPVVVAAFAAGASGDDPLVQAARIQAALEWFLYVSAIKESTTCTTAPQDCDSAWAYYSGGTSRTLPTGLARLIDRLGPESHDRAYDGVLAVRCWKNLDNESGTSVDLTTRDRAIAQLDRALLRGMALLVRQRFLELDCASGDFQRATLERLRLLVPLLDRETRSRDAASADLLLAQLDLSPDAVDTTTAVSALDAVYPCP
jgi:hypothetical protein